MNHNRSKEHWNEIKLEIRKMWGNLSDEELESTQRNLSSIKDLVYKSYLEDQNQITHKIQNIFNQFGPTTEQIKKSIEVY